MKTWFESPMKNDLQNGGSLFKFEFRKKDVGLTQTIITKTNVMIQK